MDEKLEPVKFISVRWLDAFSYDDVHSIDDDFEVHVVLTSGFLVKEEEDRLVICRDFFPNINAGSLPLVRGTIAIPRNMITSQKIVNIGD